MINKQDDTHPRVRYYTYENYEEMSQKAAELFVGRVKYYLSKQEEVSIILSAGTTHVRAYEILTDRYRDSVDWNRVNLFHMDEFCGLSCEDKYSQSYKLYKRIASKLPFKKFYQFCKYSPEEYEEIISSFFPIDVAFQGVGSNGHYGFNEPGTPIDAHARIIKPAEETLHRYHINSGTLAKTLGMDIIDNTREHIILAKTIDKNNATDVFKKAEKYNPHFPITKLKIKPNTSFLMC